MSFDFFFPGAYPNQNIHLTFEERSFTDKPDYVLVYAFHEKKLLFIHHKERGWELPGGTCKVNETPVTAAIREVYEESGAVVSSLRPIGQYGMTYPFKTQEVKTIYVARIEEFHPIPEGFESDAIQLISAPSPDSILLDPCYSLLLKDKVYYYSLPIAIAASEFNGNPQFITAI